MASSKTGKNKGTLTAKQKAARRTAQLKAKPTTKAKPTAKSVAAKKKDPRPARPSSQIKASMKKERASTAKKKTGAKSDWFSKLSAAAQKAYIKAHPNSKYAKGGAKKVAAKPAAKAAPKAAPKTSKVSAGKIEAAQKKLKEAKAALKKHEASRTKSIAWAKKRLSLQVAIRKVMDGITFLRDKAKKSVAKPTRKKYASDKLNAKNAKRLARDVTTPPRAKKRPKPMKKTATLKKPAAKKAKK